MPPQLRSSSPSISSPPSDQAAALEVEPTDPPPLAVLTEGLSSLSERWIASVGAGTGAGRKLGHPTQGPVPGESELQLLTREHAPVPDLSLGRVVVAAFGISHRGRFAGNVTSFASGCSIEGRSRQSFWLVMKFRKDQLDVAT